MPIQDDFDIGRNKLSHAYIIASPSETARFEAASRLAAAMVCSGQGARPCKTCKDCRKADLRIHPDIIILEKQTDEKTGKSKEIYVDQVRSVVSDAYILPNEAEKKVYIIKDADTMNVAAQNAVLKLLEEPPMHVSIIACVGNAGALLDTIRSRCVELNVSGTEDEPNEEVMASAKEYLGIVAAGNAAQLLRFCFAREKMDALLAIDFAECTKAVLTDMFSMRAPDIGLDQKQMMKIITLMKKATDYLRSNVSIKHVFGMIAVRTM